MEAGVTPPPEGFELEQAVPPPPPGFEMVPTKGAEAKAPEDIEPGWMKKAYNFMGGASGLGGTAGALGGAALAPATGGFSALIPILGAMAGGAGGAALEGKSPIKEGLTEGAMQGVFHGAQRALKPAWQFGKESLVKTFGSRELVSEAAENLLSELLTDLGKLKERMATATPEKKEQMVYVYNRNAHTIKARFGEFSGRFKTLLPLVAAKVSNI